MDGVLSAAEAALSKVCECVRALWRLARDNFHCPVIQQLPMPSHPPLVGNNEHRLPGSRAIFLARLAAQLRQMGDAEGVDLLALDARVAQDGLATWHNSALWHRAKQEVALAAAPMYGELVA